MKRSFKYLLLVTCLLAVVRQSNAQDGFHIQVGFAYGLPAAGNVLGSNFTGNSNGSYTLENVDGSYGAGMLPSLTAGYGICSHVDAQLRFSYLAGKKYTFTDNTDFGSGSSSNSTTTAVATGIYIEPMLQFGTNDADKKLNFYTRVGPIIPLAIMSKITRNQTTTSSFGSSTLNSVEKDKAGFYLGYTGALGTMYSVNEHISIFGELNFRGMNAPWKSGEYTDYNLTTTSGNNTTVVTLADLDVSDKQVEYVDELTDTDNSSSTEPTKILESYSPFSSFGINIGLGFTF